MNIPINKDFETEFKDNIWKGFSLDEMKYIAAGVLTAVINGSLMIFVLNIHYQIGIYIAVFTMVPPVAAGFWRSSNHLNLVRYYKARRYRRLTGVLIYKAGEYRSCDPVENEKRVKPEKITRTVKRKHRKYVSKRRKKLRRRMKLYGYEQA